MDYLKEKVVHPPSAPARPDLHYRSCRSLSFPHWKFNSTEKRQKIGIKRISPCSNMKYQYFLLDNCKRNLSNDFFVQCLVSAYSLSKWAKHYMQSWERVIVENKRKRRKVKEKVVLPLSVFLACSPQLDHHDRRGALPSQKPRP